MSDPQDKIERALRALRQEVWNEFQYRRVGKLIDEQLVSPGRRRRARVWSLMGVAVGACVVALLTWGADRSAVPLSTGGTSPAVSTTARTQLSDGSIIDVDRGGRIQVVRDGERETRVRLLAGRAEFEVQKRAGRPFIAQIESVEVRVVGTHFSTELDETKSPAVVRVRVQRGIVEVTARPGQEPVRLRAGDSLEVTQKRTANRPDASVAPASPTLEPSASASTSNGGPAPAPSLDPSKLFEMAQDARRSGNVQGAVKAYATLLKQYPSDERAGVAALELGRLRMDVQHAYGAAADAFRRAIAAAPNEGIREDALARLIEALDALHDERGCVAERKRYELRYPRGVHAGSVRSRCAQAGSADSN
jgi:TolA-binding protein